MHECICVARTSLLHTAELGGLGAASSEETAVDGRISRVNHHGNESLKEEEEGKGGRRAKKKEQQRSI